MHCPNYSWQSGTGKYGNIQMRGQICFVLTDWATGSSKTNEGCSWKGKIKAEQRPSMWFADLLHSSNDTNVSFPVWNSFLSSAACGCVRASRDLNLMACVMNKALSVCSLKVLPKWWKFEAIWCHLTENFSWISLKQSFRTVKKHDIHGGII